MSYEGHTQNICANGHYFTADAYNEDPKCGCGANSVWFNSVDDTNCDSWGVIPPQQFETLKIADAKTEECPTCHHVAVIERERYRIPTREEQEALQHRWDFDAEKLVPVPRD